jgi:hypothetical protein
MGSGHDPVGGMSTAWASQGPPARGARTGARGGAGGSWDLGAAPSRRRRTARCPDKDAHDGPAVVADGGVETRQPGHQKRRKTGQVCVQSLGASRGGRKTLCRSPEATDWMERLSVILFMTSGEKLKCDRLTATPVTRLGGEHRG